ncbi:Fic family protein [Rhizobium sp. LjRoot254]|uniref:Fic family protein n=1 Tax=Rhizobium sp. LjRoot254 TaxID=3342297 RepID=UPI003ECD2B49
MNKDRFCQGKAKYLENYHVTLYTLLMKLNDLTRKKRRLDGHRPLDAALLRNLEEWFQVELTYTSNALEGNTLTRLETALVIEKGLTVGGKTLREHLEAANHSHALDFVRNLATGTSAMLTARNILAVHEIILKGIDDGNAGHFRAVPVRISGSRVVLPNPLKVPSLMDELEAWLLSEPNLHPAALAAEAHYRLVTIHPFVDGNGRTARLLMNLILMMHGYPPAIIRKEDRLAYLSALEKAQLGGSKRDYEDIVIRATNRSLDIYLKALRSSPRGTAVASANLLKIGALAKAAGQTVATIRYWTSQGLIDVAETLPSGYLLFDPGMIKRCKQIESLKEKRMTIAEIRDELARQQARQED